MEKTKTKKLVFYAIIFLLSFSILVFLSEEYTVSSICSPEKNFRISGGVYSVFKTQEGYSIKVCNDCCKTYVTKEFFFPGEHVVLCGREYQNVKRC
ncbi:hypothetical protein KO465_00675 [Candidatus Micrarchaeota archaeon]|nr:hypothetical protein [Candidatus Micrarchaeota archaeon]